MGTREEEEPVPHRSCRGARAVALPPAASWLQLCRGWARGTMGGHGAPSVSTGGHCCNRSSSLASPSTLLARAAQSLPIASHCFCSIEEPCHTRFIRCSCRPQAEPPVGNPPWSWRWAAVPPGAACSEGPQPGRSAVFTLQGRGWQECS